MVEETREQQQMYNMFRSCIYLILIVELIVNLPLTADNKLTGFILELFHRFKVFDSIATCKVMELICIAVTCVGTKAQKSLKWNLKTMVLYPIAAGAGMIILCFVFHTIPIQGYFAGIPTNRCLYALCSIVGTMLIHQGLDAIAKYYNTKIGEDKWNFDNESFEQSREKDENEYSVNIPMVYYYDKKLNHGWINIVNPFRATIVLGTPGSGKSFGIIDPFIRQHAAKRFSMMVYDYKYPALAKTLFYQYCKNKKLGKLPENCNFRVVNFVDVEYSNRVNPIQRKYIPDLAAASETAATLLASLNKGGGEKKGGSEAFFQNSAENFLAAIIYFFVNFHPTGYKNGRKLKRYISYNGQKLQLVIRRWDEYFALNDKGETVLDFIDEDSNNISTDADGLFTELDGLYYKDKKHEESYIERSWYEDEDGNEVIPDTITGEYSDMPHVLAFLGRSYKEVFSILMQDDKDHVADGTIPECL